MKFEQDNIYWVLPLNNILKLIANLEVSSNGKTKKINGINYYLIKCKSINNRARG